MDAAPQDTKPGPVQLCVGECKPELQARSSQLYSFVVRLQFPACLWIMHKGGGSTCYCFGIMNFHISSLTYGSSRVMALKVVMRSDSWTLQTQMKLEASSSGRTCAWYIHRESVSIFASLSAKLSSLLFFFLSSTQQDRRLIIVTLWHCAIAQNTFLCISSIWAVV